MKKEPVGKTTSHHEIISQLFHALSQPLTSLHCSLEVALFEPRSAAQYQQTLRDSLGFTGQVTELVEAVRELLDADEPSQSSRTLSLSSYLEESVRDLFPVAQSLGKKLTVSTVRGEVFMDPQRLQQAVRGLLQSAVDDCTPGGTVRVESVNRMAETVIRVATSRKDVVEPAKAARQEGRIESNALRRSLRLDVARRIFETAGGSFGLTNDGPDWLCEVVLPTHSAGDDGHAANLSHFQPLTRTGKGLP